MNYQQFIQEVKNSDNCPDDFDCVYPEFRKYQKLAINTLIAFHNVCEKNKVDYQLAFGSLLGAIRDEGQIPWDYDVDVVIPYDERFKLVSALDRDLPDDYYYYCPEKNDKCRHYLMRISPKGYRSDRLHVDVFYVIGAPKDQKSRYAFEDQMNKYFKLRYIKLVRLKELARNAHKLRIKILLRKIQYLNIPIEKINDKMQAICEKYDPFKTGTTIPVLDAYKHINWDTATLWDTMLYSTSLGVFRIPKDYDRILTSIYGDYKMIFPLESRLKEMYKSYHLLKSNKVLPHAKPPGRYYIDG